MVKDIAKHYVLIMYIERYLNVKVNKNKPPHVNIASDKPLGVGIASGKSVNLSVANKKSLCVNVTKGELPNMNVAGSFVVIMGEYIKETVEGHSINGKYVQVKNLMVKSVPISMDFNCGTTDLFDAGTKINRGLSLTSEIYSFGSDFNCSGKSKERVRKPMIKFDDVLDESKVLPGSHKIRLTALNVPPMGLFYPMHFVSDVYPPPPRTWFNDHEDMLKNTWQIDFSRRSDVSHTFYPYVNGGLPMWESYPTFSTKPKKEENFPCRGYYQLHSLNWSHRHPKKTIL